MARIFLRGLALGAFLVISVTVCNAQTQFNSTGAWTEFKNVENNVQARVRCAQGGPNHGRYLIQFKNSNANQITLEYQVTGNVSTTPKKSLNIGGRSVTNVIRIDGMSCGNVTSQDIFVTAFIVTRARR